MDLNVLNEYLPDNAAIFVVDLEIWHNQQMFLRKRQTMRYSQLEMSKQFAKRAVTEAIAEASPKLGD